MIPSERLAEIEARVEAATPGEWVEDGTIFGPDGEECDARTADYEDWVTFKTRRAQADRELWIEARSDIPWLLEQVRDLRSRLQRRIEADDSMEAGLCDCVWCVEDREALADSGEAGGEAG